MLKRYFNWKLAIILVIGMVVLGVTAFGLRRWQRASGAERGLILGNKAYNEYRWEEATRHLGRYIAVKQNDIPTLLKYAEAQLNIRPLKISNIKQAEGAWRRVLRADKTNSEAALKLIEMYLQMGTSGEAELIVRRQLKTRYDPGLARMLALALANQRKFDEAAAELKAICAEHPRYILAYETLGQLAEQRPEYFSDPPGHWFDEAVKNNPSMALAYIIRASFYLRSKDNPEALADLQQAEKLDLSDPDVRLRLASEFINANALDKAEEHLTVLQKATPANQTLWQMWARLALKSQSQEKMLKIAETGLEELSSQPWDFMPAAAELYIRCGELGRASDCVSKLRKKDIAPATTAFLEGLVADKKGHGYEAVKCWYRAIQLGGKPGRTRLALAATLSRLGDKQSAIKQLRTLVSEQPSLLSGRINLARLLTETGNWAEAAEQARMAKQISPGSLNAALLYVQARIQLLQQSQTDKDSPMWQDIEGHLAALENATDGALEVKLLQFQLAMQRGGFTVAEALVNQLKETHPSQIKVAMAEVELLTAQDRIDEAISMLNNIVEGFPQDSQSVRYLTVLLARRDEREKCEAIIKDALVRIEEPVTQQKLCLLLADLYDRWGQEEKAYKLLTSLAGQPALRLVGKLPNDVSIKRQLLKCKQVIQKPQEAQQIIDDIKSLEGEDGWQWRYEQARFWFRADDFKNRYPHIISLLHENLLANPDDQASRMLLATAYERAGDLQLALLMYRDALARSPDDIRIIIPAVAALYKAKEYDQADEILNRASQSARLTSGGSKLYHSELQKLQLQSYLRHGQLSSASDILQELISNDPDNKAACFSLALLKMQQNKFAEAGELLAELKTQEPNSLAVTYAQIQLNIRQNKPNESLRLCNEAVNNLNSASAYILRARTYVTLDQADKAIEDLEHATAVEPNNVEVWLARSRFYRFIGRLDRTVADMQQALSLASDNVQVQKRAISLFLASDNPDRVRQGRVILGEALESNPEDIELRLFKARLLLAEGTAPAIESAELIIQKITEDQPKFSDAWALWAEIAFRQGQSTKAIDIALRGLVHRPNDKTLLLLKARSEAAKLPALAIPTLKALRELDPNDADVVVHLAGTYLAANQPQQALNLLKTQLESCRGTPDERKINVALAMALHKNGNEADAQKEFGSLLQSDPNDPSPLLAQAKLLKDDMLWDRLNQKVVGWYQRHPGDNNTPLIVVKDLVATEDSQAQETAEDILRTVLKNAPDYTEAISTLAILLQITGRFNESTTLYQKLLALEPDNVIAINNLAWIMCEEQGKYQQALKLAQRGLEKAPDYIDLIDTRGVVYYRLGEFDQAIQDFTTCIKLYPGVAPPRVASRFHLGRAYAGLGQKDRAIEYLNQVLDLEKQIGGLSRTDLAEVQRLVEELSQGG